MRPLLFSFSSSWSEWKHCDRSPNIHSHVYAPKQTHSTFDMPHSRGDSQPLHIKTNYIKKKKNVRRTQEITILNYTLPSLHEYETWGKGIFQIPRAEWDALAHHFQRCLSIGQLRTSHVGFHRLMGESHHQELMDTKSWLTSVLELGCCPPLDLGLIGLFPDTSGAPKQFCPTAH